MVRRALPVLQDTPEAPRNAIFGRTGAKEMLALPGLRNTILDGIPLRNSYKGSMQPSEKSGDKFDSSNQHAPNERRRFTLWRRMPCHTSYLPCSRQESLRNDGPESDGELHVTSDFGLGDRFAM
jgi:hypothetical protein